MKKIVVFLLGTFLTIAIACQSPKKKVRDGADILKFRGSWFLRVYELDYSDTVNPGKRILVEGNEIYKDMSSKLIDLIQKNKIQTYSDSGTPLSSKQVLLNLINESLRATVDTSKPIDESNLFNIKLLGIELNDSIFLDIKNETKQYKMHSINIFIPAEYNGVGGNQSVCRILHDDLIGKGLDAEVKALEERKFSRKEKIYHSDGTITEEYTFYLTDAAGVQYLFTIPLEQLVEEGHMIKNSILSYFVDDIIDRKI